MADTNILRTEPETVFLIEQEQDAKDGEINKTRKLTPSMKKFSEIAKTELISRADLEAFFNHKSYQKAWLGVESVPYTKRMFAMVFCKNRGSQ